MVLGINNRTENWKTACHFVPYSREPDSLLGLVRHLGETDDIEPCEVHMELFWKGIRDYLHGKDKDAAKIALLKNFDQLFPDLRDSVQESKLFRSLKAWNYVSSHDVSQKLFTNLYNTEIDIVIETPKRLFIGEAKHEMSFDTDSKRVLVHQLIRQYVMAKVLLETLDDKRQVIPFVVGDNVNKLAENHQIQFMIAKKWMNGCNVLDWNKIASLGKG